MKLKRFRYPRLTLAAVLAVLAVGALHVVLLLPTPLERLAARAQAIPAWHAGYITSTDDSKYWEAQRLERVIGGLFRMPVSYGHSPMVGPMATVGVQMSTGIVVDDALHWTSRLEVLAHEAGHLFMPSTFHPLSVESEVFAEAVSYLVCRRLGHDSLEVSARYLAKHKHGLDVLRVYAKEIEFASDALTLWEP